MQIESSRVIKRLTKPRTAFQKWMIACLLFGCGLGLRFLFAPWLATTKFLTFYPAIAAATLMCGWVEGLSVAVFLALAAWYFLFGRVNSFEILERNVFFQLAGFLSASGFIVWIVELLRRAVRELDHEVTARGQAEAALRENDQRKDQFLATLAHELRNPLAPIHNVTQVLRKKHGPGDPDAPMLDMIDRQLGHITRLVDDLLEVARVNLDKLELRKERIDIAAVVRDAVESCRPLFEGKGQGVTIELPKDSLWVSGDTIRLTQVTANLLSNAAKYTPQNGVIHVAIGHEDNDAILRVRDNGIGLPADMLTRVFELFTQIDGGARYAEGGLGVGLALARKIVELHGGRIEARSDGPGLGSEFVVRFPLSHSAPEASTKETARPEPAALKDASSPRVLVIDDEKDVADSLGLYLKTLGASVRIAYDGPAGVAAADEFKPELVFVDIGMPGVDGYETARLLSQSGSRRSFTLVALTGWGQKEDRRRTQEAGFDLHLTKPAPATVLEELLERCSDSRADLMAL